MLIGVLIAVGANTVIPIGLNLQKYAHRQAERQVEGACPSACIPLLNATRNVAACTAHGTHLSAGVTVRQLSAHVEPPAVSPRPLHRASLPTCPCLVLFRLTLARAGSSSVVSCATAGQVATPFTSNPVWWAGLISMISGEVIPFSHETKLALDCPSHHRSSAGRNAFCDISFAIYSYALCLCQAFNLLAYGYSPTSLVAPVGAIGVLVNGEPHEAGSV